jgi:hypothetical protein
MRVSNPGKKTVLFSHLYIKLMILPRQARDKHRENSPKNDHRFAAAAFIYPNGTVVLAYRGNGAGRGAYYIYI